VRWNFLCFRSWSFLLDPRADALDYNIPLLGSDGNQSKSDGLTNFPRIVSNRYNFD
jgi:hypothetical protein